jgi:heat shock protein HtpX
MATIYTRQSSNIFKTYLLMGLFLVVVCAIGYFLSNYYSNPGIFYAALLISLLMNVLSFWYSDRIVLTLAGAKEAKRDEYFDLYTLTENLSITAGLPMPRLFVINDPAPNAFATGRDKNHAVVAVTDGLLERLERPELEGVIAHELSHIGNRDILLMSVVVVLVGMVSIISDMFVRSTMFGGRDDRKGGGGIFALAGVILIVLSPIIATIIKLAISRRREFLADSSAALLTRYPEGLARALEKISSYETPMRKVHSATAHLFISSPLGAKNSISILFSTHPPIEDRIKALRGLGWG